jgi:HTH-type transcriptional regulator / antitoxin HigA
MNIVTSAAQELTYGKPISSISRLSGQYGELLKVLGPKVIETEQENRLALKLAERLMEKGDAGRSREESAVLELLAALIERFEQKAYPIPDAEPREVLRELMEHNAMKAIDLSAILGSRSKVSEILSGKRSISKGQAKRLGERFHVSPALFI